MMLENCSIGLFNCPYVTFLSKIPKTSILEVTTWSHLVVTLLRTSSDVMIRSAFTYISNTGFILNIIPYTLPFHFGHPSKLNFCFLQKNNLKSSFKWFIHWVCQEHILHLLYGLHWWFSSFFSTRTSFYQELRPERCLDLNNQTNQQIDSSILIAFCWCL